MINVETHLLYCLLDYMHKCAYNIKMEFEWIPIISARKATTKEIRQYKG